MEQKQSDKVVPFLKSELDIKDTFSFLNYSNKKVVPIDQFKEEVEDDDIIIMNIFDPDTGEYTKKALRRIKY